VSEGGIYIYGAVRSQDLDGLDLGVEGEEGATVRSIEKDGVAALVSELEDASLEAAAALRAHWRVLEEASGSATVLPVRFGTVMESDKAVRERLLEIHSLALGDPHDEAVQRDLSCHAVARGNAAFEWVVHLHGQPHHEVPDLAASDAFGQRLQHCFAGPPGAIRVEPGTVGDPRQELRGRHCFDVRASAEQRREVPRQLGHDVVVLLGDRPTQCGEDGGGITLCGREVNLCALADPAHKLVDIEALRSPRASVQPGAQLDGE